MLLGTRGNDPFNKRNTMKPNNSPSSPSNGMAASSSSSCEMIIGNHNRKSAPSMKQSTTFASFNHAPFHPPQASNIVVDHNSSSPIHTTTNSTSFSPLEQQQQQLHKHYSASKTCFKQGIMIKQGAKVKNYKTRYFLLYSNRISYHKMNKKKEYNKTPQGEISLKGLISSNIYEMSNIDQRAQKEGLKFGFIVADKEHARNYYLFTESREESLEWIQAIHQVVNMSCTSAAEMQVSSVSSPNHAVVQQQQQQYSSSNSHYGGGPTLLTSGVNSTRYSIVSSSTPTSPSHSPSQPFSSKKSDVHPHLSTSLNLSPLLLEQQQQQSQGTPRSTQRFLQQQQQVNVDNITSNYALSSSLVNSPRISNTQNSSSLSSSPVVISSPANSSFTGVTSVLKGSQESELTTVSTSSISFIEFMNNESTLLPTAETSPRLETVEENVTSTPVSTIDPTNQFNTPNLTIQESTMTDEEEFSIALNAAAIFLKDEMERTPQEQAYVVAMNYFRTQLEEHSKKHNCKPAYGLALGTVIFCIPEEQRTAAEQEYYQDIVSQFMSSVDLYSYLTTQLSSFSLKENEISTPTIDFDDVSLEMEQHLVDMSYYLSYHSSQIIPIHIQVEIAKACKEICRKPAHERTLDEIEFVDRLCELHNMFKRLYYKSGIIPNQLTLLASILLGMDHELFENFQVLEEMKLKSNFEQTQMMEHSLTGLTDADDELLPPNNFSLYANMLDVKMYELREASQK
ncbi:hypothetical protein C9374_005199 [Naegleria lovaniensis]|uniref:PH domain-containing protein n=1 Tax=Naegleria lovaniensis TaxID=51637 RepID=A0AA88GKI5_NAELO|nr:uncharacterized protein C9374_005199 [Naegleria lovaniensis]KAG2382619.1 hypothetical protein C9374_005199 [Naegleria lovaniensis]